MDIVKLDALTLSDAIHRNVLTAPRSCAPI
jgi:hypothetical protein